VPERVLSVDGVLDDFMFYWLGNAAASSARVCGGNPDFSYSRMGGIDILMAASVFPAKVYQASKSWCERSFPKMYYYIRRSLVIAVVGVLSSAVAIRMSRRRCR